MSILNPTNPTPEQIAATQVTRITIRTTTELIQNWESAFDLVWGPDVESELILAEIGTNAAELIGLSNALVSFFNATLVGRRDSDLARINYKVAQFQKPHTSHPDGTVTIDTEE